MGRRGRHAFLDHWHRRHLELPDGDVLRWILIDDPARRPLAQAFRSDRRGAWHPTEACRVVEQLGHPHAALVRVGTHVGQGLSR